MNEQVEYQIGRWKVVKKQQGDFAMSYPWKTTNGSVCSDHTTRSDAIDTANHADERDESERVRQIKLSEMRYDSNEMTSKNEMLVTNFKDIYKQSNIFLNYSPREWFALFAEVLKDECLPKWAIEEWPDLQEAEAE